MFIASRYTISLPAATTRARLASLVTGGGLQRASHTAYSSGLDALIRVGPLGDAPLMSKLVAVRFLEPVERNGVTTAGLHWEATGPAAGLFPVLDANLTLPRTGRTAPSFPSQALTGPPSAASVPPWTRRSCTAWPP